MCGRACARSARRPLRSSTSAGWRSSRTRQVRVDGAAVELSAREFALAELFFRHPGQVLSREQILSQVWGYDFDPGSNVVDVYVGYLRKKIGRDRIASIRRMGYRLEQER